MSPFTQLELQRIGHHFSRGELHPFFRHAPVNNEHAYLMIRAIVLNIFLRSGVERFRDMSIPTQNVDQFLPAASLGRIGAHWANGQFFPFFGAAPANEEHRELVHTAIHGGIFGMGLMARVDAFAPPEQRHEAAGPENVQPDNVNPLSLNMHVGQNPPPNSPEHSLMVSLQTASRHIHGLTAMLASAETQANNLAMRNAASSSTQPSPSTANLSTHEPRTSGASENEDLCKICVSGPCDSVFLPCGHLLACEECAKQIVQTSDRGIPFGMFRQFRLMRDATGRVSFSAIDTATGVFAPPPAAVPLPTQGCPICRSIVTGFMKIFRS
jgi:hypothetical protein